MFGNSLVAVLLLQAGKYSRISYDASKEDKTVRFTLMSRPLDKILQGLVIVDYGNMFLYMMTKYPESLQVLWFLDSFSRLLEMHL